MKSVILLGMGATMVKCPYDDETWGVNKVYHMAKKLDKLFITDRRYFPDGSNSWNFDELNALDIPIVSLHRFREIKRLSLYPYNRIVEKFGTEFFTNSICYMLAYAIYKKYKKIRMYGIDMVGQIEYQIERGGIEYWVGRAEGMGIEVTNTKASMVCKTAMGVPYGFKYKYDIKEMDPFNVLKAYKKKEESDAECLADGNGGGKNKTHIGAVCP